MDVSFIDLQLPLVVLWEVEFHSSSCAHQACYFTSSFPGDPYMGFFTRLLFNEPTCISSLTVHCLKPLTGAEEMWVKLGVFGISHKIFNFQRHSIFRMWTRPLEGRALHKHKGAILLEESELRWICYLAFILHHCVRLKNCVCNNFYIFIS